MILMFQFASQLQTTVLVSQMESSKSTGITIAEEHCACRRCVANTCKHKQNNALNKGTLGGDYVCSDNLMLSKKQIIKEVAYT
jgi:hypothetical protein